MGLKEFLNELDNLEVIHTIERPKLEFKWIEKLTEEIDKKMAEEKINFDELCNEFLKVYLGSFSNK